MKVANIFIAIILLVGLNACQVANVAMTLESGVSAISSADQIEKSANMLDNQGVLKSYKTVYLKQDYFSDDEWDEIWKTLQERNKGLNDSTKNVSGVTGAEIKMYDSTHQLQLDEALLELKNEGSHGFIESVSRVAGNKHYALIAINSKGDEIEKMQIILDGDEEKDKYIAGVLAMTTEHFKKN